MVNFSSRLITKHYITPGRSILQIKQDHLYFIGKRNEYIEVITKGTGRHKNEYIMKFHMVTGFISPTNQYAVIKPLQDSTPRYRRKVQNSSNGVIQYNAECMYMNAGYASRSSSAFKGCKDLKFTGSLFCTAILTSNSNRTALQGWQATGENDRRVQRNHKWAPFLLPIYPPAVHGVALTTSPKSKLVPIYFRQRSGYGLQVCSVAGRSVHGCKSLNVHTQGC